MKKTVCLLLLSVLLSAFSFGQVQWNADPQHSNARFKVEHMGLSFIDGEFTELQGAMESPAVDNFDGAVFNYTIKVKSVDTREKARDAHLLTDDFFDAEQFPEITLTDAKLKKIKGNNFHLKGQLRIKDVSKPVTFKVTKNGTLTDEKGLLHVGFTATTTIDRTNFNINYNGKLPNGIDAVGKDIKIVVNTELIKKES